MTCREVSELLRPTDLVVSKRHRCRRLRWRADGHPYVDSGFLGAGQKPFEVGPVHFPAPDEKIIRVAMQFPQLLNQSLDVHSPITGARRVVVSSEAPADCLTAGITRLIGAYQRHAAGKYNDDHQRTHESHPSPTVLISKALLCPPAPHNCGPVLPREPHVRTLLPPTRRASLVPHFLHNTEPCQAATRPSQ